MKKYDSSEIVRSRFFLPRTDSFNRFLVLMCKLCWKKLNSLWSFHCALWFWNNGKIGCQLNNTSLLKRKMFTIVNIKADLWKYLKFHCYILLNLSYGSFYFLTESLFESQKVKRSWSLIWYRHLFHSARIS